MPMVRGGAHVRRPIPRP